MFTNNEASFIKLADSRGKRFLKESTFSDYKNLVVTDRYAVYNYFSNEKKTNLLGTLVKKF
jgi:transposase